MGCAHKLTLCFPQRKGGKMLLCRDCFSVAPLPHSGASRCQFCHSVRTIYHPELPHLTLAHIDCDAFFAAIEKRDAPELANKPVIVGGGKRGGGRRVLHCPPLWGAIGNANV